MIFRLFIILLFLYCDNAFAQNCLDQIRNFASGNTNDLINGTKWIYEKKNLGSPMLEENFWPKADILYKGIQYTGVLMNYDVYKNEVIVSQTENGSLKYVVISKDNLSGFSYTDTITNTRHSYEYFELPGVKGKAIYENATTGKVVFFIKPLKNITVRASGDGQGEFSNYYDYYLKVGNEYKSFHSKGQLLKLLSSHGIEIKRFIRKRNLKINNTNPRPVIAVLGYFNELN